jgi:osmotically-inducible protein OsmY
VIISRYILIFFVALCLAGCPAAIIGGGAVAIDTTADRRTHGIILEDSNIEFKSFALIQKIEGDIHTNVTSYNGHVLIVGQVPNTAIKSKIEVSIKAISNVKSLSNELTIGPVSSISARAQDALITSNVKARFFKENKVPPFYVKVVTENKVVYLMGILTEAEAQEAENITKNTSQVTKVVKLFEFISPKN